MYNGIITDCGSVDPGSIPGLRKEDVVAEWLTRLTANQFLSGAQVRVLPTSLSLVRYGVVGNMSGSHPVASGSIPGIGLVASLGSLSSVGRASA